MATFLRVVTGSLFLARVAIAQQAPALAISGRVLEDLTGRPIVGATVTIEARDAHALTDSLGRFTIRRLAPGAITIRAQQLGWAPLRTSVLLFDRDLNDVVLRLARSALSLREVRVTADRNGQVTGELGTGTVIDRDAIRTLGAASLAGILELVPGTVLQPPGLDAAQQVSLRTVPVAPSGGGGGAANAPRRSAEQFGAFGTQVIIDGVPLSNNANLQSLGPRAELSISSVAGGGVDLRRIPAATLERVEVIRGVASARYGDLTNGVILVETRAGRVAPEVQVRADPNTLEASVVGGTEFAGAQAFSATMNATRTQLSPGLSGDQAQRVTLQLAHRLRVGGATTVGAAIPAAGGREIIADTRLDLFALEQTNPESPTLPGSSSYAHNRGFRLTERLRRTSDRLTLSLTAGLDHMTQNAFTQELLLRGASPFTSALTAGRHEGKFVQGQYLAKVKVDGTPTFAYARAEASLAGRGEAIGDQTVVGTEFRSEGSGGSGLQFDPEFPPSTTFDGIAGYDRPRRYDDVPRMSLASAYVDRTLRRRIAGILVEAQGGLRLDGLFVGAGVPGARRDAMLAPRLNVILRPTAALAFRAGVGRFAKMPALGDLSPGLQYNDVINVNYFANTPAERLAVLTTYLFDRSSPSLGFSHLDRGEVGVDLRFANGQGALSVVAYADALRGGVAVAERYATVVRNHYALGGPPPGSGQKPTIIEPPSSVDTVPVLVDTPTNNSTSDARGVEMVASFPEIPHLRLRIETQAQYATNRVRTQDVEFGRPFTDFQQGTGARSPFWDPTTRTGERLLLTTRLVYHQPSLGLVITTTVQNFLLLARHDEGGTDTLSFAGYIDRQGQLTRVAPAARTQTQYADLRRTRTGFLSTSSNSPREWLFNLQVAKALGDRGWFTFYAFNAVDRVGSPGTGGAQPIFHPATRFGVELSLPLSP